MSIVGAWVCLMSDSHNQHCSWLGSLCFSTCTPLLLMGHTRLFET